MEEQAAQQHLLQQQISVSLPLPAGVDGPGGTLPRGGGLAPLLWSIGQERYLQALAAVRVTTLDGLLALPAQGLKDMGLPLGPRVAIEHLIKSTLASRAAADGGRVPTGRSKLEFTPQGIETVHWARVPCVPPFCWHRCAPRPRPAAVVRTETEIDEDDPVWRPTPVTCSDGLIIHPISIGIPDGNQSLDWTA